LTDQCNLISQFPKIITLYKAWDKPEKAGVVSKTATNRSCERVTSQLFQELKNTAFYMVTCCHHFVTIKTDFFKSSPNTCEFLGQGSNLKKLSSAHSIQWPLLSKGRLGLEVL